MKQLKVLLVGVGTVGEAIAKLSAGTPWLDRMVLADYDVERARLVQSRLGGGPADAPATARFPVAFVDAGKPELVTQLAREHGVDIVVNGADPRFVPSLFDGAFAAGVDYLDMAVSLSEPHPTSPFTTPGVKLGDYQFPKHDTWKDAGRLAILGLGMDPGLTDLFAAYAHKHLFDQLDEVHVRDGGDLYIEGYAFATVFSIWTTIEECLNPPIIWEKERGWYTTEPFSELETFEFPEGIGAQGCVNVEHEEVLLVPRWVKCKRVTFKYGLGDDFIRVLKTIKMLGLDNKNPIQVGGVKVAPRDVVAACLPDPAHLGDKMFGKTCAGTWVKGKKDGKPRQVYLYQVADNETCMKKYGVQAVVWQTAVNPVIAMELLHEGVWQARGVFGPEAFDPDPFMQRMAKYDFPCGMKEM